MIFGPAIDFQAIPLNNEANPVGHGRDYMTIFPIRKWRSPGHGKRRASEKTPLEKTTRF
jgi:hypothetical protein